MRGTARRFRGKYDFFTICFIPGATVLLASLDSWTGTNLSVLGSGNKLLFALWGFSTGLYYCIYMFHLFHMGSYRNRGGKGLVVTAAAFFLTAVIIPYAPEQYPLKARLHVLLAFLSPILLTLGLVCFLHFLSARDRPRFWGAWCIMWILAVCSLALLFEAGFITSFLEVFLVVGLCGYLRYLEYLLSGCPM